MDNTQRYEFRNPQDALLWSAAPGVALTSAEVTVSASSFRLRIEGIARETPSFEILVSSGTVSTATNVTAVASIALFAATVEMTALANSCTIVAKQATADLDRVSFAWAQSTRLDLSDGATARLESVRRGFLAGTSDRMVERNAFSLLLKTPLIVVPAGGDAEVLPFGIDDLKIPDPEKMIAVDRLVHAVRPKLRALYEEFRADADARPNRDLAKAQEKLANDRRNIFRNVLRTSAKPIGSELRAQFTEARCTDNLANETSKHSKAETKSKGFELANVSISPTKWRTRLASGASSAPLAMVMNKGNSYLLLDPTIDVAEHADWVERFVTALGSTFDERVGVFFNDRLRYRPAGLVCGEQLYTLSLSPGEEVQVRQTVETKRQAKLEDIEDREEEKTLTLSSTWSTDVSQALTDTANIQTTLSGNGNIGVGPFSIPLGDALSVPIPISGNTGVAGSISEAHTQTSERSARVNTQLSAQASAKLRRQHKTRIEITNEQSSGLATTRTLRNPNQLRAVTYVFNKVYRREQVTLERYRGRLCFRLLVDAPSDYFRKQFLDRIAAMDPDNPANYEPLGPAQPDTVELTREYTVTLEDAQGGMGGLMLPLPRVVGYQTVGLPEGSAPSGFPSGVEASKYELAATPSFEVIRFRTLDTGRKFYGPVQEGEFNSEAYFFQLGGAISWMNPEPMPGVRSVAGEFVVGAKTYAYFESKQRRELPRWYYAGVASVTLRVRATFRRSAVADLTRQTQNAARRTELTEQMTTERLLAVRDALCGDFAGSLIATAVVQNLALPVSGSLNEVRHIFNFEDVVIETVPYWAANTGLAAYEEMRDRLQRLPIVVSVGSIVTDVLTCPQAVVYLPVREGYERQALTMLLNLEEWEQSWLVHQIDGHRAQHFETTAIDLPDDLQVSGPVPPIGTRPGATSWQSEWEKPRSRFDVLASWQELIPTDGVHLEAVLSDTVSSDEHRTFGLENIKS